MKDTIFIKPGKVELQNKPMPQVEESDDAIIKVVRTCVCGSDLWSYRGLDNRKFNSQNNGHESIGIVKQVGSAITTVKPGDFVICPFTHGCGRCSACRNGYDGSCLGHQDNSSSGNQAEYMRYQHAQWSLVKVPGQPSDYSEGMLKSILTLADVMATGYHSARTARVKRGDTVAVIGDGAVGLCGIISAQLRGAKRIISLGSSHTDRQKLAKDFGATEVIPKRGEEAVKAINKLTHNQGADAVLECVGTGASLKEAVEVAGPGATVGRVGLPHNIPKGLLTKAFYKNVAIAGGIASVTTYDKSVLLKVVLDGKINPGKVFNKSFTLDNINDAYKAMANRKAIKSFVIVK